MTIADKLKLIQNMEDNAHRLLNDAAALKEELSGGSDSSNSKQKLSKDHITAIIKKRRVIALRK